jgi:hypothetical protein
MLTIAAAGGDLSDLELTPVEEVTLADWLANNGRAPCLLS